MIFVLESYFKNRRAKIDAWKQEGQEWVRTRNAASNYTAYHFEDYQRNHPSPAFPIGKVAATVLPILGVVTVVTLSVAYIVTRPPKQVDPNNPHDCSVVVKKGDKVGVLQGDFGGSKGTILDQRDDCSVNMTLDESTYTMDVCKKIDKGYCESTLEKGEILNVDKSSNIVKL